MPLPLTPAQARVAALAQAGLSNREIAQCTGTTESTVKNHLNALYQRSPFVNRHELIAACQSGSLGMLGGPDVSRYRSAR